MKIVKTAKTIAKHSISLRSIVAIQVETGNWASLTVDG